MKKVTPFAPVQELIPTFNAKGLARLEEIAAGFKYHPEAEIFQYGAGWVDVYNNNDPTNHMTFADEINWCILNRATQFYPLLKALKGRVIVDLGAGKSAEGYILACRCKARGYVAVEPINGQQLFNTLNDTEQYLPRLRLARKEKNDLIPCSIVAMDAVSFLQQSQDHSFSILVSGLDSSIIRIDSYAQQFESEMLRVADRYILSHGSRFFNRGYGSPPPSFHRLLSFGEGKSSALYCRSD